VRVTTSTQVRNFNAANLLIVQLNVQSLYIKLYKPSHAPVLTIADNSYRCGTYPSLSYASTTMSLLSLCSSYSCRQTTCRQLYMMLRLHICARIGKTAIPCITFLAASPAVSARSVMGCHFYMDS